VLPAKARDEQGAALFTLSNGGLAAEASIGGQKFQLRDLAPLKTRAAVTVRGYRLHVIALLSVILLALVHAAPSFARGLPADLRGLSPDPAARTSGITTLLMADLVPSLRTSPGTPPCLVGVCQPVVAVPGFEPRWDARGRRTELFLSLLGRMDVGAISSAARWIAATGVTADYRMPDRAQALQFNVSMRWRIGAFGGPLAWME